MGTITDGPDEVSGSGSDSDNISEESASAQFLSLNYAFDGTNWDRLRSRGNNSDNVAVQTLGILDTNCYLYGFDAGAGNFDRLTGQTPSTDNLSVNSNSLKVFSQEYIFNENGFDRKRGNTEETILASAARTSSVSSSDFTNFNAKGIKVVIDVTADPAAASVTFDIEGKDPISGNYYSLLTSAAVTAVGTTVLTVFPGIAETANLKASDILPRTYRVTATHADGDSITYSVSGALVV